MKVLFLAGLGLIIFYFVPKNENKAQSKAFYSEINDLISNYPFGA